MNTLTKPLALAEEPSSLYLVSEKISDICGTGGIIGAVIGGIIVGASLLALIYKMTSYKSPIVMVERAPLLRAADTKEGKETKDIQEFKEIQSARLSMDVENDDNGVQDEVVAAALESDGYLHPQSKHTGSCRSKPFARGPESGDDCSK